jgi:hypothetical protein
MIVPTPFWLVRMGSSIRNLPLAILLSEHYHFFGICISCMYIGYYFCFIYFVYNSAESMFNIIISSSVGWSGGWAEGYQSSSTPIDLTVGSVGFPRSSSGNGEIIDLISDNEEEVDIYVFQYICMCLCIFICLFLTCVPIYIHKFVKI